MYRGEKKKWLRAMIPVAVLMGIALVLLIWSGACQFQRFGSLIVAAALVLFGVPSALNRIPRTTIRSEYESTLSSVFLALVGTIIWGYGDFFHNWINGEGWIKC
jgi:hypothetical protein